MLDSSSEDSSIERVQKGVAQVTKGANSSGSGSSRGVSVMGVMGGEMY